jgi:hypothetical protein
VAVNDLLITRGTELSLQLETTISAPSLNSPDILVSAFSLATGYPNEAERGTATKPPVLTRESDNGHCGTGETVACVIVWKMVLPELTQVEAGGTQSLYNQQYIGSYGFRVRSSHYPRSIFVLLVLTYCDYSGQRLMATIWRPTW